MARGLLSGFVLGAAVSACAAGIASYVAGPPASPEVSVQGPAAGDAPAGATDRSGPVPRLDAASTSQPPTPVVQAPEVEGQTVIADDATRSADRPEAGRPTSGVEAPAPATESGGVTFEGVAPISPNRRAAAPTAPAADRLATVATAPPRPSGSDIEAPGSSLGGQTGLQMPDIEGSGRPVAPQLDTAVTGAQGMSPPPGAPDEPDRAAVLADPAPRPEAATSGPPGALETAEARDVPETPVRGETPGRPAIEGRAPAPGRTGLPETDDLPPNGNPTAADGPIPGRTADREIVVLPQTGVAEPSERDRDPPPIGTPATSLLDRSTGPDEAPADPAEPARPSVPRTDPDLPALLRNAEPFDNPEAKPLMSIILTDTGQNLESSPVGLAALGSFPHPLSFAVDMSLPDAAERAAEYRASGHEVLAMVDLPPNLTAADTEVALTAMLARMPQSVAVLEGSASGLQGNSQMSIQVSAILDETGHGIVWRPNGLGAAQRLADRFGVPSRTLFREFDSDDQTPVAIRRVLDHAALTAGQEGAVIMVGRVRPDTISALLLWSFQDRAQRVAVAPVSTVLLAGQEGG